MNHKDSGQNPYNESLPRMLSWIKGEKSNIVDPLVVNRLTRAVDEIFLVLKPDVRANLALVAEMRWMKR